MVQSKILFDSQLQNLQTDSRKIIKYAKIRILG